MIWRAIVSVTVIGLISMLGWRIAVGRSRLVVDPQGGRFPTVSGFNLERKELEFPRDFGGELNLLFVPFLQRQQLTVNTWLPFAQELEQIVPGLVYYELPTIDEMSALSRTFINEGMRAGIPDPKARQRTVTLYIDTESFRRSLDIPGKDEVHILLVDRAGNILWRTTGDFDLDKGQALVDAIKAEVGAPDPVSR